MTDTFSYLLFPKLFCPKKLSLVTKTLTGPFFMCGIEAFCLFLRTNCIKGFLMFRLHQDILHCILIFQKKWSHVISRDVLESFHVYQISIRFHPLCQSHSKETIFIWKNPVKRQKKKITIQSKLLNKRGCWPAVCLVRAEKGQSCIRLVSNFSLDSYTLWYPQLCFFPNWPSPRFRIHVKNIIKAWSGSVVAIIDCKTVRIFAYSSTR